MHPVIARFMNADHATQALERDAASLSPEEKALVEAAKREPKTRALVLKAKGKTPSLEAQQALIVLATQAATDVLLVDEKLGPAAKRAIKAFVDEGATPEQARAMVAAALLEEAFGYAEEPDHFDAEYLAETLDTLLVLAKVREETVDDWLETFAKTGRVEDKPLRMTVAEELLRAAFDEGPQPITPEHTDDALDAISGAVASKELEKAASLLVQFLESLAKQKIIGPTRLERLVHLVRSAAAAGLGEGADEEADEEE